MAGFDLKEALRESENYYGKPLFTDDGIGYDSEAAFRRLKLVRTTRETLKKELNDKRLRTSIPSENMELYENVYSILGVIETNETDAIKYGR